MPLPRTGVPLFCPPFEAEVHVDAYAAAVDPRQTSFPLPQVFKKIRKALGRNLT